MIKTDQEIESMREGGRILADVLQFLEDGAHAGVSPLELDARAQSYVKERGAIPAFLNFDGFPAATCISRGPDIVHGIPTSTPFEKGELVSFDFGILHDGLYTDAARSVLIDGSSDAIAKKLVAVVEQSFYEGLKNIKAGSNVGDIGSAVQAFVESQGFSVIRALVGHGVGRELHEDPRVPNFGKPKTGPVLEAGMTIAVEPMIAAGHYQVVTAPDGWTVRMADNSLSAHFEQTLLITHDGYEILTKS